MLLSVPQEPGCSLQSAAWHSLSIGVWCVKEHIPLPHSFNVHAWRHLFECASPACLPHPPVADVTPRGSLPTVGRGTALTSLSFLVLWKHLWGFTLRLINHLHSFKAFVISSLICLFSKLEKSLFTLRKKQNPNKDKNTNPKPNPSSLTKTRNNSLLRLF